MHGNTIWTSLLDKRYVITVTRTEAYRGELTILDTDQVLHREPVGLTYGAQFGPDIDDVSYRKQIAAAFVDRLDNRR